MQFVIIGAGGHARVLLEALRVGGHDVVGFVTPHPEQASGIMARLARLGSDDDLIAKAPRELKLINGIGSTGRPQARRAVFERFRNAGFVFASVVHPAATVASDAELGEGTQVMARAVLQPGTRVGVNAIVNTGAVVDHDGVIGDHVHVAPGACLAGGVVIGEGAHVGAGAVVIQNIRVGADAIVAAGAVVVAHVAPATLVKGVPAGTSVVA